MTETSEHLDNLKEIKSMMEKSSRFVSLSGLSGISAGICALVGAGVAHMKIKEFYSSWSSRVQQYSNIEQDFNPGLIKLNTSGDLTIELVTIAVVTLIAAVILSTFFTMRRAKQKGQTLWNNTSRRLVLNVGLPLVAGGLFCLILLKHNLFGLLAPTTLIFFGMAMINGSKFTLPEIKYVGVINIMLGLLNGLFIGYGLVFWALGFGVVNIAYGIYMYLKYERTV
ncbi:MAG: uncharacterized membrane protein YgdD (TMEM256/DUF423 family) [Glaciecola sp.]|jgi:uncharacterized membrane protein YgdD (TMEM256/DUF423 family)